MLASLVLRTALFACVATAALAQPRDTLRIAVLAPNGTAMIDPHRATAHYDRMPASWVHGALVRFRPGSINPAEIEPDLAEGWTASEDERVWTFALRPGTQFHQGAGPVTAEDVAFSLRKAANPATSAYAGDFTAIEAIEVLGPLRVRIVLSQPVPSLLGLLANYAGGFILSHKAATTVGFGPFMLADQTPGQSMRFAANPDYFRGRPKLVGITYRFVGSLAASDLAFNAGELDIIEGQQSQAWIDRTRQLPNSAVDVIEPAEISMLHLNITQPPLDDLRVRRAIALAVNRPELLQWRGADLARPARGVLPAAYLGFAADPALGGANIEEARRLLAEAGYPNGVTVKTIHTSNPVMLSAIQVVQAQLRRAGITLDVEVVDHPTFNKMIRQDLSPIVHYAAARFPVADTMLTQFFHSRSIVGRPAGVTNFSHCTTGDAEIDTARGEPQRDRQLALWAAAQSKISASLCAVPLLETLQVWARRADFDYGFPLAGSMSTGPLITEASHFRP